MSFTDPEAEPVQPDEGQGDEATPDAPYAEYLNRIPEEVRGDVEPIFKEWDGNTTKKFQEASEYRKSWEPYESLGVNQRDPAEVEWALQMLEAAKTNPHGVQEWFEGYAKQHGLTPAEAQKLEEEAAFVDPSIAEALEKQLSTHLGPVQQQLQDFAQWREAQEQERQYSHVQAEIRSELDSLKEKHKADFDEPLVDKFIANHMHETDARVAVQKAFADAQAFRNQIEKQVLQSKAGAGPGAESGGAPASGAEPITDLKEASKIAAEMLRQENRARAGG